MRFNVWSRFVALVLFCACVAMLLLLPATATPARATEFGVYKGPGCDGRAKIAEFEAFSGGRKVERTVDALDRRSWGQLESSADWITKCWEGSDIKLTLSVPMLPEDGGASTLKAGASGRYDESFRKVGRSLVANGYPDAIVRIGWEANGEWMAWSGAKDPASYRLFWRRIVEVMRETPGQKFLFEWCPNVGLHAIAPILLYPGDDVVDVIGLDVYNEVWQPIFEDPERRWIYLVEQPYGLRWHKTFAEQRGKPISFPEWGTGTRPDGHGAGDDPRFVAGMAEWFKTSRPLYQSYWDVEAADFNARLSNLRYPKSAETFVEQVAKAPADDETPAAR